MKRKKKLKRKWYFT